MKRARNKNNKACFPESHVIQRYVYYGPASRKARGARVKLLLFYLCAFAPLR